MGQIWAHGITAGRQKWKPHQPHGVSRNFLNIKRSHAKATKKCLNQFRLHYREDQWILTRDFFFRSNLWKSVIFVAYRKKCLETGLKCHVQLDLINMGMAWPHRIIRKKTSWRNDVATLLRHNVNFDGFSATVAVFLDRFASNLVETWVWHSRIESFEKRRHDVTTSRRYYVITSNLVVSG